MKLEFEQIKNITQGAEQIAEENGNIKFFRFGTEEQELYLKTDFFTKTFSTANIQLEFKTDGDFLNFVINASSATSRTYFSLDVFVNNKFAGRCKNFTQADEKSDYTIKQFDLGEFSKRLELGKGEKTVRIVFPWSVAIEIKSFEIENASYVIPVKKDKKMLVYGDSITNGYDALYSSGTYVSQLSEELNVEVYNKAIGGEVFFPDLAKIKNPIKPDYILVAYGTNDWGTKEKEDFYIRCEKFYENISKNYPDSLIFAITPIWRKDFSGVRKFGDFFDVENTIKNVCKNFKNIKVISGFELVPHDEKYFADLRLHPNNEGFKCYFDNLIEQFKKYI